MNVLFITRLYRPHVGGVERHVEGIAKILHKRGYKITIVTEKFGENLKEVKKYPEAIVYHLNYPKIKLIGLLAIWLWFFRNLQLIRKADLVHIHDVFVWYLPFRFLFPRKPVYITFHGWEGMYPIPRKNIFQKQLANFLTNGSICVGKYIEKYYHFKADYITYGAVNIPKKFTKKKDQLLYLGRLDRDTGLRQLLGKLEKGKIKQKVVFCGDGPMRSECEKYGQVLGFIDPSKYLAESKFVFVSGYLSVLESLVNKCEIMFGYDNPLKRDYYQEISGKSYDWAKKQSWDKLANIYLELWKNKKPQ